MSNFLAIDTSTEACSVALKVGDKIYEEYQVAPRQHGELVLPMIDKLLKAANIRLTDLDCIAYGQGPGAFTGLRICISIVQGLAFGANVPVIGCSSLQTMAQLAYSLSASSTHVISAIDARMGEVYWGQYQVQDGIMTLVGKEAVLEPTKVAILDEDGDIDDISYYATGSGWDTYAEVMTNALPQPITIESEVSFPKASAMFPWVELQFQLGLAVAPEQAQPVYLRNNVAKKKAQQGKS